MYNSTYYQRNKEKYLAKQKEWVQANKEHINKRQKEYRQGKGKEITKIARIERRKKLTKLFEEYLQDKCCIICGENRRPCLCFHHRNPDEKKELVPRMVHRNIAWKTILKEIEKCDIICHNCHSIIHFSKTPLVELT